MYNPEITEYPVFLTKIAKIDLKVQKLDIIYNKVDSRCWSAIVDPIDQNIIVTYHINKLEFGDRVYDIVTSTKSYIDIEEHQIYELLEDLTRKTQTIVYVDSNE